MKAILLLTLVVAAFAFVRAADIDESDVIVGTSDNFSDEIAEGPALVEFYAPWCGHCKRLAPEWAKAATALKGEVKLIKVDATEESDLASQYGVQGYPTLKFFKNGKLSADYDGERSAEAIASWCRKRSGPAATPIQDKDAYDQWAAKNSGTKIVAFAEQDSDDHKTVLAVAEDAAVDEFAFAVVFDKDAASQIVSDAAFPGLVILKGEETTKYDGEFNTEDILAWVLKNGYPLIEELSQNVFKRASTSQRPLFVGFTNSETGDDAEQTQFFTTIATDLAGKALFSFVAHNKFPNLASQWGASGNKYPTAVVVTWAGASPKIRAFDEADEFTVESVKSWAEQCLSGTCKAFRKSEPIPESNDEPVTVVVGKNFEDIVFDSAKDVLVEFYAPWCGHCKKLAPIYDQLGERFANVESVVIAKSDATANGYPDTINIRGFPTLLFFKADDKANPITYEGDRDLASIEKFILEKASVKVDASQLASTSEEDHDEL